MIRKFGRIDAPVDMVKAMFLDPAGWPRWMPGLTAVRILSQDESGFHLDTDQQHKGRRFRQELDCRVTKHGFHQRQLSGWFKKWEAGWRFRRPPDGQGTTVSCEMVVETGFIGLLIPSHFVQKMLDDTFRQIIVRGQRRVRDLMREQGERAPVNSKAETLLQVFQTPTGLEVWVGDQKYVLEAHGR